MNEDENYYEISRKFQNWRQNYIREQMEKTVASSKTRTVANDCWKDLLKPQSLFCDRQIIKFLVLSSRCILQASILGIFGSELWCGIPRIGIGDCQGTLGQAGDGVDQNHSWISPPDRT